MAAVIQFASGLIGAAAPAFGGAATGAFAAGASVNAFLTTTMAGRLLSTVAFSALAAATAPTPAASGIRTQYTMVGGTNPASFILGYYSTEGQFVCPPMSHGQADRMPNAYLTYVIELGDISGQGVDGLFIDGEEVAIGATPHADYGLPIEGRFDGYAWIKTYDGSQVAADPMLLDKYGSYPERPWTSAMVGEGIPYAILTFRLNRDVFKSFPKVRFVSSGIPLYDPRKDDTVGGAGSHRWDDKSTWETSNNGGVQAYNIARGIELPGGHVWGGGFDAEDLPLSNWFAAMNACDATVSITGGGTEPAFRTGYEVFVADEPMAVLEEIGRGCAMQFVESGGFLKVRVGGPGLPVLFITDADFEITNPREFNPFPPSDEVYNGVHASYPDPEAGWQSKDAPPLYNATHEAEDGERNTADVSYPAVPYALQVQRLNVALLEEERRFRRHSGKICPEGLRLEPLDAISWTSSEFNYSAETFEVTAHEHPLRTSWAGISIRARSGGDWVHDPANEQSFSSPSNVVVLPSAQTLTGWTVTGASIQDNAGGARGPALLLIWPTDDDDVSGIAYEVRVASTQAKVAAGTLLNYASGSSVISSGIEPGIEYDVRVKIIPAGQRDTAWSAWVSETAPAVRVAAGWHRYEVAATTTGLSSAAVAAYFDSDPAIPSRPGDIYVLVDVSNPADPVEAGYVFDGVNWVEAGPYVSEVAIFDDAIYTRHLRADSVTSDKVLAATLSALSAVLGKVEVTEALDLKKPGAKFLGGKRAPSDLLTPGFLIGRVQREVVTAGNFVSERQYRIEAVGTTDFTLIGANGNVVGEIFRATGVGSGTGTATEIGYEMSATSDASQSISGFALSDGGAFRVFNPTILIGDPSNTPSTYTVSTNVNLGPNQSIIVSATAGGGAGGAGTRNTGGSGFGADGGDTVVKVYDGDPSAGGVLFQTLTALKGLGGENAAVYQGVGEDGEGTSYGIGGAYGPHFTAGGDAPALSFGAGGGSAGSGHYWFFGTTYGYAGKRGTAGAQQSWEVDTSGFANDVWLEITIGQGGARNTAYDYDGGAGADGAVEVQSALAGLLDIGYGSAVINRSYGPTSTGEAAINAGNVDLYNDALPSGLVGNYLVTWSYATETDATTDETWSVSNSLRLGATVLNSDSYMQDDTPNTRSYDGSEVISLSGGEEIKFRWDQSGDNDISRADLDYLNVVITGPYKDLDA